MLSIGKTLHETYEKYSHDKDEDDNYHSIITTTLFVNLQSSSEWSELTIDELKKLQMVGIHTRARQLLYGEICKPIICIKRLDHSNIEINEQIWKVLKEFGINQENILIINEFNSKYLKSFGNFIFKQMIKKKLIQNIPVGDVKVGQLVKKDLVIKLYIKKPYYSGKLEAFQNDSRLMYLLVSAETFKHAIFNCKYVHLVQDYYNRNLMYGIYETSEENELMICDEQMIVGLSHQNITKCRGQYTCLGKIDTNDLIGLKVSCSIIPNELTIAQTGFNFGSLPRCSQYNDDFYRDEVVNSCLNPNYYSMINSVLIESYTREEIDSSEGGNVIIDLDSAISSSLLQSKLEEKPLASYQYSEVIDSLFIKRGLGFHFIYEPNNEGNAISLEDRWCLIINKKWSQQLSERIGNETIRNIIRSGLRDVILSRSQEFEPDEYAFNYLVSNITFLTCLQYFKEFNIQIEELNDQVWDYLLNTNESHFESAKFEVLKRRINAPKKTFSIVDPPVYGARSAFFSSMLRNIPEFIISNPFLYNGYRFGTGPTAKILSTYYPTFEKVTSDGLLITIQTEDLMNFSSKSEIYSKSIVSIFNQSKKLSSPTLPIHDSIIDQHLIMQTMKALKIAKENYRNGNFESQPAITALQGLMTHAEKLKRKLNHDFNTLLAKYIELLTFLIYPLAPKLCTYLWYDVLQRTDKIVMKEFEYSDEMCEIVSRKFSIFRDLESVISKNKDPNKRIAVFMIGEVKSEEDMEACILESKDSLIQLFINQISDIRIEKSNLVFGKTVKVRLE